MLFKHNNYNNLGEIYAEVGMTGKKRTAGIRGIYCRNSGNSGIFNQKEAKLAMKRESPARLNRGSTFLEDKLE